MCNSYCAVLFMFVFFFFFKQKTAYEMRISDWSSDVCSSDLLIRTLMTDKMPDQLKLGFALWTRDAVRELIRQRCGFLMPVRTVGEYQIGRASCRERVCQYV